MGFFNRIFRGMSNTIGEEPYQSRGIMFSDVPFININLYKANGGWVVEYKNICRHTRKISIEDEPENTLHIIHSGEDIGNSISKIINFELLRK